MEIFKKKIINIGRSKRAEHIFQKDKFKSRILKKKCKNSKKKERKKKSKNKIFSNT
jgi:hypothetical protein